MPAEQLSAHMTLERLFEGIADAPALPLTDIQCDSRRLVRGALFLACRGATHHALEFAAAAARAGAAAIAYDSGGAPQPPAGLDVPLVPVAGLSSQLGEIANRYFDAPSKAIGVAGVTGTNGKTTVAWLIAQCLGRLGRRAAYSGTLGHGIDTLEGNDRMTTPDAIETHRRLAAFRDARAEKAAVEVSSHALDQRRVDGVQFEAALFTNLTRDHLDYHGSMREYAEAKAKLFVDYPVTHRIVNLDSDFGSEIAARCGADVVTVSMQFDRMAYGRAFVFARDVVSRATGSEVEVHTSWGDTRLSVPLPGHFNVANALQVLAYLLALGVPLDDAARAIAGVGAPPGRMQRVAAGPQLPAVYVDYAHTPDALEVALRALTAHCRGKLWCVFGCGGDRDPGKRPLMGRIAERVADCVVVTNDNPRSELPKTIFRDILAGVREPAAVKVIEDRASAIAWAVANAAAADTILVAGKGHETCQVIGAEQIAFSDYAVAERSLEARAGAAE